MTDTKREFVAEELWLLIAIVTVALTALAGAAGLEGLAGAISILGLVLLTPIFLFWGEELATLLFDEEPAVAHGRGAESEPTAKPDALEELKRRYAAGEIDDAEFERRLERLVAVENLPDDVFDAGSRDGSVADREYGIDRRERERERE
ncbi:SHOCT domain-containing protein [Natronolimnohabitans sp. A-GB9]|uniref:SHOCT domain-containing protein n=1 Tax=Natronolimnohabitans sp. A-GB9 TaxID=3069757 RepID=UPI0027AE1521|nr:SHOCT domain-containing protein [Natronolimnohabitans sp. A-GB9]MDQ2049369.1 SHOCT domain-containing protein [Natronolimnohabitans sp. A-GB9]